MADKKASLLSRFKSSVGSVFSKEPEEVKEPTPENVIAAVRTLADCYEHKYNQSKMAKRMKKEGFDWNRDTLNSVINKYGDANDYYGNYEFQNMRPQCYASAVRVVVCALEVDEDGSSYYDRLSDYERSSFFCNGIFYHHTFIGS